ncbi:hypothetical protein AAVH_18846 [Aphelenchoides avenae]|nr:hypothetical protein AAVH_18846 [Aphelenchus avenae]
MSSPIVGYVIIISCHVAVARFIRRHGAPSHKLTVRANKEVNRALIALALTPIVSLTSTATIIGSEWNEDATEAVPDAESADADNDDYEEMILKKRKLEKHLSSQDRTAKHGSGSLTQAKEYIKAVLYQDFRADFSNGGVRKDR